MWGTMRRGWLTQRPSASFLGLPRGSQTCSRQQGRAPWPAMRSGARTTDGVGSAELSDTTEASGAYTVLRNHGLQVGPSGTPSKDLESGSCTLVCLPSFINELGLASRDQQGCKGCVGVHQMGRAGLLSWTTRSTEVCKAPTCPCVRPRAMATPLECPHPSSSVNVPPGPCQLHFNPASTARWVKVAVLPTPPALPEPGTVSAPLSARLSQSSPELPGMTGFAPPVRGIALVAGETINFKTVTTRVGSERR